MTYQELLRETAAKKAKCVREFNTALNGDFGFLVEWEISTRAGSVAWNFLGREFCDTLEEHMSEILETADEDERDEICRIVMAYEDDDPDIYEILPYEAQLFER